MSLAKEIKRKTDEMLRLQQRDPAKTVTYVSGTPTPSDATEPVPSTPGYTQPAAQSFRELTDTPGSYAGQAGKAVIVKAGEDGLEFGEAGGSVEWPDHMEQDADGLKIYDGPAKTNLVALIGRKGEEADVYTESTQADFATGELVDVVAGVGGLELGAFHDDFARASLGADWSQLSGAAIIENNQLRVTGGTNLTRGWARHNAQYALRSLRFRARADTAYTSRSDFRFAFNHNGTFVADQPFWGSGYYVHWAIWVAGQPVELYRIASGAGTLLGSYNMPQDGQWHDITVTVDSGVIKLFIDGVERINVNDSAYTDGYVFFGAREQGSSSGNIPGRAYYDDVVIAERDTGHRTSPPIALSGENPGLRLEWQATTPAGTSVALETAVTGEEEVTETIYNQQVFTESGTFTVPEGVTEVDVLVVGGGGAGGGEWAAGGGGAGGLVWAENVTVAPEASIAVTVGQGGAYVAGAGGADGQNSSFADIVALGGGRGGGRYNGDTGADGGSGGGGRGHSSVLAGGAGLQPSSVSGGYGTGGGNGFASSTTDNRAGGGGGGAGASGLNAANQTGGAGGAGRGFSAILGTEVGASGWFAGGGGGARQGGAATHGVGQHGGGNGGSTGSSGQANTGGGGGGGSPGNGGGGGSGVVIVRWVAGSTITTTPIPPTETAEVQTLYLGGATGGTFTLGDGTKTTSALAYNSTAAAIQTALVGIFGSGRVTVAAGADFTITFDTIVRDSGLVADFANLTGATSPALTVTTAYDPGDWAEQTSGELISNIPAGDLTGKHLWLRQRLETTDTSAAPTLTEVKVFAGSELYGIFTIDGTVQML